MSKFFSLAYLTLPNTHPVDQIEIAAQCGYEGVGPVSYTHLDVYKRQSLT